MSHHNQIYILLSLYPDAPWSWSRISAQKDITLNIVLAHPEWPWNRKIITLRFAQEILADKQVCNNPLYYSKWNWEVLTQSADPQFITNNPDMPWLAKVPETTEDIIQHPDIKWDIARHSMDGKLDLRVVAAHMEYPWPWENISLNASWADILAYPFLPWNEDIITILKVDRDDHIPKVVIDLFPHWKWKSDVLERYKSCRCFKCLYKPERNPLIISDICKQLESLQFCKPFTMTFEVFCGDSNSRSKESLWTPTGRIVITDETDYHVGIQAFEAARYAQDAGWSFICNRLSDHDFVNVDAANTIKQCYRKYRMRVLWKKRRMSRMVLRYLPLIVPEELLMMIVGYVRR